METDKIRSKKIPQFLAGLIRRFQGLGIEKVWFLIAKDASNSLATILGLSDERFWLLLESSALTHPEGHVVVKKWGSLMDCKTIHVDIINDRETRVRFTDLN